MAEARSITTIQAAAILISTIIGVGVLPLPLFAVHAAESGAPLITFISALVAMVSLVLVSVLGMRFPSQTISQYSETIIGKWPGRVGSIMVIASFAILTSMAAREFGEVVITAVLPRTPLEVTVMVMLLLAAIATRNNITTFAYIHFFYFPFILVPALLITVLALKNADTINLLPIWGNGNIGIKGTVYGILTIASLFQSAFVLTIVIPAMRRPNRALQASIWSMVISGGLYVTIVLATVSVFGSEEIKNLLWPTLELAKATSLPANVLERLDAAFLAVWVTAVFTTLFSTYFLTVTELGNLFHFKDHRMLSFFLLPILFLMAMLPQNILQMYTVSRFSGLTRHCITIGYPAFLLIIAWVRGKRGDRT
ncbi:GerAB/ArcD/ProY family transporter [Cohnella zeiphila]|uniref:Endospore germination permease n=1 Tax=Cohnella zeiphila TaxID=2761120 RepID=A0A7X0VWS8_9BACL|nr:endospore germination permease [Cohnella zeiphila]MBB6732820.1 endospore germination permease [Cohnella zeiphila]